MTKIAIQVPDEAKNTLIDFVKELGEVISISGKNKASKKSKLLDEIKQGLEEVKKIRKGKAESYAMSDLFDGK